MLRGDAVVERLVGDAVADQGLEVHVLAVAVVQRGHGLVGDEQEVVLVVAVGGRIVLAGGDQEKAEKNQQKKEPTPELVEKDNTNLSERNIPFDNLKKPSAEQLIARSLAQASKHYDLIDSPYFKANKPRRKYITANNKDHRFASYMEAWRAKVERVGNINYPYGARKKNLSGKLLLDVAILQDGTVQQITIRRSSGKKILDRAAVRIVELAAPFAPLPESITREVDILHITRTWNFVNDSQFTTP